MALKYPHLLSPIIIGKTVFKNRLLAAPSRPHFVQGQEPYPTEALITHYANKARNGAAMVTCKNLGLPPPGDYQNQAIAPPDINDFNPGRRTHLGGKHNPPLFNLELGHTKNYLSMLTETIHFYGGLAEAQYDVNVPPLYDVSSNLSHATFGSGMAARQCEEIPTGLLDGIANEYALVAYLAKEVGFDSVYLYMCYRTGLLGRFLSPLTNKRRDQYGGNLENMARFPLMVADRIKQKCGQDFIIEAAMSGCEPPGGFTLEDAITYAKMFAGHIDLLQVRAGEIDPAHPTNFNPERTPFLYMAEAIKKSGADIKVVTVGGYLDLDLCEEVIASGKADFITAARAWISNPEYGRLAYEGRNEDVVPCLRCNGCHISSYYKPWNSVCSVNPVWGLEHKIERMISPPADKKKVAVIGGGPAGMEAALVAARRGHAVTLYEKTGALGGLFKTIENVSFKWPHKDFKNYLVRQVEKAAIQVFLNTAPTPEMIKEKEYQAVLAAVGAEPLVPAIPGINSPNVVFARDIYGRENTLGENIVIIGGGEVGVEAGMHLAENGHRVTVLEMTSMLAREAVPIHFYSMFKEAWEKLENFKSIINARCTGIGADKVTYLDAFGKEQSIQAENVIIAVGMKPRHKLALQFYGTADRFFMIGDCRLAGDVQRAMRSAFSTASML